MGFWDFLFGHRQDQHAQSGGSITAGPGGSASRPGTSRPGGQQRFATRLNKNNATMLRQLEKANGYRRYIEEAARKASVPPSVICGIGSRESHWGLALKPPNPGGRGDFAKRKPRGVRTGLIPNDGGGYGRGLMQIDYDWNEFARTGNWQDPRANLLYAAEVLNRAKLFFQRKGVPSQQMMQATIAAYNAGPTATYSCISAGKDLDCKTTGRDYSRDVYNRAGWFQLHGWR
ncbi:transglycosylase SLT domain-containing protein [Candidatus Venteria ishoeyi]|uniref:Transglycosylase SLT domain protein n=1 Tax=Candidatus Venteria ishoeyi TaxID=1899563 RepID=A0A1H6FED0_9GAMM|nr:transglycosylase SLT domain-containing protein [Candidatus Venteria ishoeyi]MDM8546848.1 transglycosylase SLT domain-containing protein [Candidatus Venteria ishoeyi]SEH08440.1 Transglycosylase SLT domain protein [Candidatus Venteria ishoeyi]